MPAWGGSRLTFPEDPCSPGWAPELLCPKCSDLLRTGEEAELLSHALCFCHHQKWSLIPQHQFHPCEDHLACRQKNTGSNEYGEAMEMLSELQFLNFVCEIFILALIASGFTVPLSHNQLSDCMIFSPMPCVLGIPKAHPPWEIHQDSSYRCTRSSDLLQRHREKMHSRNVGERDTGQVFKNPPEVSLSSLSLL